MLQLHFSPFPTLYTARLILRKPKANDAEQMLFLRSDERVMRYIDRPPAKTLADAVEYIERINRLTDENEAVNWGITLGGDDVLIGTICFWRIEKENYRAEVGYMLHPAYHRQGLMTEALTAALKYGFDTLKFHSITANVNPANDASISLLKTLGFEQEAYFRQNYFYNGKFLDTAIFCKLNPLGHDD